MKLSKGKKIVLDNAFGEDWNKQMMKHTKKDLVFMFSIIAKENLRLKDQVFTLKLNQFV